MRILTRYLLRAHLGPFLFALFALTGILFVNAVAKRFADLAGKGLPAQVILEVLYLSLPHILALTLPMAVLVAVLYAWAQLTSENEITALKASGVSLVRLLTPMVVAGVLIAGFMVWFNDTVLPGANHRLKNLIGDVIAKTPTLQMTEQVVNPLRTGDYRTRLFLKPGRVDHGTQRMWDITIYDLSNARKSRTIFADSGSFMLNPSQTDMMLTLYDGVVHEVDEQEQLQMQRIFFELQKVELKGVGTELTRSQNDMRSDREMSIAMLQAQIDTARLRRDEVLAEADRLTADNMERVLTGSRDAAYESSLFADGRSRYMAGSLIEMGSDDMAYRAALDAQRLAHNLRDAELRMNEYAVEYHKKFAIPFACIIFVLIGAPLAVRFPRGGVGMVIAASLAIFGIYYVSLIGGETLGDRGIISPFWGPWAPNLLFGLIGLFALSRLGREKGSTRGGGWDDLWLTLRGVVTSPFGRRHRHDDARREAA
jgi:lipopolysaccharide export system permease protein